MSLTIEERQLIELRIRNDAPSAVVAYVMWGFLGLISAHRFYLGRPRSAVLQILSELTVVGWFIWWLYDAVMISAYIRDDKVALRTKLIEELEAEKRGGFAPPRPAPAPAAKSQPSSPPSAPSPAPETKTPLAEAAAMSSAGPLAAGPAKVTLPKPELVLDTKARQPLMLDEAPLSLKPQPFNLDDEAKAQPAAALGVNDEPSAEAPKDDWAMAEQPVANEATPARAVAAGPTIPHPETVDASPIEVFPRPHQPIDSLTALDEELRGAEPLPSAPTT